MKLNAKRFLFFSIMALGFCLVYFLRFPVCLQSSLNDLFPKRLMGGELPKEVINKYANILNIVVESDSFEKAKEKSDELFTKLKTLGVQNINYQVPSNIFDKSLDYLKEYKNSFLSLDVRQALLKADTNYVYERAFEHIQTSWIPPMLSLQEDPFLLLTDYVQNIPKPVSSFSEKEGVLWQQKGHKNYIWFFVKLDYNDIDELVSRVHLIQQLSVSHDSTYRIHLSGTPIHTVQMFERTKKDISIISFGAILILFVLTYLLFHCYQSVLLVVTNLIIAFISGILCVFLFSPSVHFLTFAFGTSLVGICIDYSFHRFYSQDKKFSVLLSKNIFYSFLTTVSCFIPLLFSHFSLLYQIALFTIGGLCGTFLWVFISPMPSFKGQYNSQFRTIQIHFKRSILICFIVVSIFGLTQVHMDHSVQSLYKPSRLLQQEESFFHTLNDKSFSHILLIHGDSLQSVLEKEEQLKEQESFFSLSTLLPSLKRQKENFELIQNLYDKELKKIQFSLGLKNTPAFKHRSFIDEKIFQNQFDFLFRQFVINTPEGVWSVIPLMKKFDISRDDAFIFEPAKYLANQLDFYALKNYQNLLVSFVFLFLILWIIYRKKAFQYLCPSLFGCVGTLGLLSLCGQPITFFHLLSLFVVIGLSMDYTIFLFSTHHISKPVLFSFLSSFVGFGLLSFVHFHMVVIMGQTIALGLLLSFIMTILIKKN